MSQDSTVGIATGFGLGAKVVRVPVGSRIFFLHIDQTSSGALPASDQMGTGEFFPRDKVDRA
jgi:hypothetical protein